MITRRVKYQLVAFGLLALLFLTLTATMPLVSPPPNNFLNLPPILISSVVPRAFNVGEKWNVCADCSVAVVFSSRYPCFFSVNV